MDGRSSFQLTCDDNSTFAVHNVTAELVCGNLDACFAGANDACASTWGAVNATCVDRPLPSRGYDCSCGSTGYTSRVLQVSDPFDTSFVQDFAAASEAVEGAGDDVVVACAYTACDEDQHVQDGQCIDCIPGAVRAAGDTTHTGATRRRVE
jgi:hypothetical protein